MLLARLFAPVGIGVETDAIPDKNLFMMCNQLCERALSELPAGYHLRTCRIDELEAWKAMHFDDPDQAVAHYGFMTRFFDRVYAPKGDLFFRTCRFVCDSSGTPVGTGFIWRAYGEFSTIHWLKVIKSFENRGIGRGLLSALLKRLAWSDYPVYLHTQPSSYRAIHLYSDFGFEFLTDRHIGTRSNDLEACLPILRKHMTRDAYRSLRMTQAPERFLRRLSEAGPVEF